MKIKKNALFLVTGIIFILLTLFLNGCSSNVRTESMQGESYTVTDSTGSKITFKKPPKRIVSLSCSVDEILIDMIDSDRIAALTYLADDPGISSIADKAGAVKLRAAKGINIEAILAMNPDLVILPDWSGKEQMQGLRDVGIPVYIYKTPVTIKEIEESIREIAHVVHAEKQGEMLVAGMQKKLYMVQKKLEKLPESKKQTLVAMSLMGAFGGKDTTFDDICHYAHVINGVSKAGINKSEIISKEMIVEINPDVLLMPKWDFGNNGAPKEFINSIRNDQSLQTVKAIKNNKIIQVNDAHLYSISHYAANAVEDIAKAVYPEYFSN